MSYNKSILNLLTVKALCCVHSKLELYLSRENIMSKTGNNTTDLVMHGHELWCAYYFLY